MKKRVTLRLLVTVDKTMSRRDVEAMVIRAMASAEEVNLMADARVTQEDEIGSGQG